MEIFAHDSRLVRLREGGMLAQVTMDTLRHVTPQPREFHLLTLHLPTAGKGMLAECGGAGAGQCYREKNSFTW